MNYDEVFSTYFTRIYKRCLYALFFDEQQALEITQEVFTLLWKRWPLSPNTNVEGWLRLTAKHLIHRAWDKRAKDDLMLPIDRIKHRASGSASDCLDEIIDRKVLLEAEFYEAQVYAGLTPKEAELARYIRSGKTQREIAELIGSTEGAVSMASSRLKRKVKRIVREIVDGIL